MSIENHKVWRAPWYVLLRRNGIKMSYLSCSNGLPLGSSTYLVISIYLVGFLLMTSRFVINICYVISGQPKIWGVDCFQYFVFLCVWIPNSTVKPQPNMDTTPTRRSKRKSTSSYVSPGAPSQHKKGKISKGLKVEASTGISTTSLNPDELLHLYLL